MLSSQRDADGDLVGKYYVLKEKKSKTTVPALAGERNTGGNMDCEHITVKTEWSTCHHLGASGDTGCSPYGC